MDPFLLAPYQTELIERPAQTRLFLEGQAGSGKTTVGVRRMLALLREGIPASELLLMFPQRTLAAPYQAALQAGEGKPGGQVTILTVGGLARRMVDLYWPMVAHEAGFARPDLPPSFLTLETALYYMAYLVRPLLDEGVFDSVTIERNRIYSQILDNLNKAATVGFPYTEIGERLRSAWTSDTAQAHVTEDAQRCATLFREYCLRNNLLDFSLQMEIFRDFLWPDGLCRDRLQQTYRHLIFDNIEEDTPLAHDLLRTWLPCFDSALLIYDQDSGHRRFLGADPETAGRLVEICDEHHIFTETLVTPAPLRSFSGQMARVLERPFPDGAPLAGLPPPADLPPPAALPPPLRSEQLAEALHFPDRPLRFFPQMLDWVVEQVDSLLQAGESPGEIALLAPLLPDSLRFALSNRLEQRGIPFRTHRPSRSLREEPPAQALLTLAQLAHPQWGMRPSNFEVAYALIQSIQGLDLVRSQLLVDSIYRSQSGMPSLLPFERIQPDTQERITYSIGNRYEALRKWLEQYTAEPAPELDFFFSRVFGEVLSQPGYAFHSNYAAGTVCANLIESAQKFRWAVQDRLPAPEHPEEDELGMGQEYIRMIQDGILAAQYIQSWQIPDDDAVLIAPAYTFLLANQPVDHQFWLDVGSQAWAQRLYQPLTHPYILSREWQSGRVWTDADEFENSRETLFRLMLGLIRRCRKQVHLGLCDLSEGGYESRGILLRVIQMVMQQSRGYPGGRQ